MTEFLELAPQFALVIIFMWFVLELGKRSDKQMLSVDEKSSKSIEAQNARYMEAIALQNDQYKAALNDMNDRYVKAMEVQITHYEQALAWRDKMLTEQRESDRVVMRDIVTEITKMAGILDRHDKETSEAIAAMFERSRILENIEPVQEWAKSRIQSRLPKTKE